MAGKQYSNSVNYEQKLKNVMERLGIEKYNYDWTRQNCFVEFYLGGQFYRFEHSLEKAKATGQKIQWVSDLFAQLVLTLEDIARMKERGIYELGTWIEGLKALPPAESIPSCFTVLGFTVIPTREELSKRYKQLAKISHPDVGGDPAAFNLYRENYEDCLETLKGVTANGEVNG
ncbi:MAG: J domain-containing protein [Angelakisella sp.]